jgi:flagellar FliL protein
MESKKGTKKEKKGGGKSKIIIIFIVILLIVGAGGYFGYTLFLSKKTQVPKTQHLVIQPGQGIGIQQPVVSAKTYALSEFLVNLADTDQQRYLKITISLGYDNSNLDSELKTKDAMIRDAVISVLTTKKAADITPKNMDSIKLQLIQKINPLLTNGQLNNIYINDILVQ